MSKANEIYLNKVLSELGPEALAGVAGLAASTPPARTQLRVRTVGHQGVHPVGVAQVTSGHASARMFAKVQRPDYRGAQTLEREMHFLSDVGPRIAAEDPALRTPRPIALYQDRGLLLMEFVPGQSMKHHLFHVQYGLHAGSASATQLLRSSGQWLGRLHRLTQQSTTGNPLEWLLYELERARTADAFSRHAQEAIHDELLSILGRFLKRKPDFRRHQCQVHGEFTPLHVLVAGDAIYVVDFGTSTTGFVYEDVGLFTGFYDCLLPWRAAVGAMRINLMQQKQIFLDAYFGQAPARFGPADIAIMRWVRLISSARMLDGTVRRYTGGGKQAYHRLARRILRDRFAANCRAEIAELRNLPPGLFDEEFLPAPAAHRANLSVLEEG